jgi:hypothetical protein
MKIFDNKIWRNGQKIGWVDGDHIRTEADNRKLGYFANDFVYNMDGRKVAHLFENELRFEGGGASIPLEKINEEIEGAAPLLEKCAVHVLLQD